MQGHTHQSISATEIVSINNRHGSSLNSFFFAPEFYDFDSFARPLFSDRFSSYAYADTKEKKKNERANELNRLHV